MTDHKPLRNIDHMYVSSFGEPPHPQWLFRSEDVRSAVEGLRKEFQDDCLIENCVLCLDDDERIKKWFPVFYDEEEAWR